MLKENEIQDIITIAGTASVFRDEPMKKHTTIRIGGPAKLFVIPKTVRQILHITEYCRKHGIPFYILGNGSNLLVSDKGYDGIVIQIYKNLNQIEQIEDGYRVQAGALLSVIAARALEDGREGIEFAAGIPGTLGGAVMMNAGAYGGEMKHVVEQVTALTKQGRIEKLNKDELKFDYRRSALQERGDIALEAVLHLKKEDKLIIKQRMEKLQKQRMEKQPLDFPSAGSVFKRPEGNFAGKLVMDAGFGGYQIGGAKVSKKHCGFIINVADATAADVLALVDEIKDKVKKETGVALELEIKLLGEF